MREDARMPETDDLPVVTIGVDLATSRRATGLCVVDWRAARPTVRVERAPSALGVDSVARRIADLATETAGDGLLVGIDAPMGWPSAWVDLLARANDPSLAGVRARETHDEARTGAGRDALALDLRWRHTDSALHAWSGRAIRPMTASTDRLAATAARCVDLLAHLVELGVPVDRTGASGVVREVYPSASMFAWRHPTDAWRTRTDGRAVLLERHGAAFDGDVPSADDEHHVDAFFAALTVAGRMQSMTDGAPRELLAREGVMWVPALGSAPRTR
jgi:hypothetical protein